MGPRIKSGKANGGSVFGLGLLGSMVVGEYWIVFDGTELFLETERATSRGLTRIIGNPKYS